MLPVSPEGVVWVRNVPQSSEINKAATLNWQGKRSSSGI